MPPKKNNKKAEPTVDVNEDLHDLLDADTIDDVEEFVSTGSLLLDYAIANRKNGGVPVGRITELIGENQAGKTLILTHILANAQRKGGVAILIDMEHDVDKTFSVRLGLKWGNKSGVVYKENLNCLEEVFDYIEKVINITRLKHKDKLIVIGWDSIAATPAGAELEGSYDPSSQVALHARIMSKGLRKIRKAIKFERIALVCTNQLRTKIGVSFGDPNTTSHGKAMSFYSSVRVKFVKTGLIKDAQRVIGANCEAKIIKNKVGPAWRVANFPVMYDWGVDNEASLLNYLFDKKVVTGTAWKVINVPGQPERKFRNADFRELFRTDKDLQRYVIEQIDNYLTIEVEDRQEFNIDVDSILEVEQLLSNKTEKEDRT